MSDETPVALVTGGGTGIGAACCRALAAEGFRVGVHYRSSEETARKLAAELPDAFTVQADLSVSEEVDALVKELKEVAGRVDVLVNNAGANVNAPILTMKLDDYDLVAGMARGTWYLTKLVLRRFMLRKRKRTHRQHLERRRTRPAIAGQIPVHHGEGGTRRIHQVAGPGARRPRDPGELGGARLHRHRA